jgi:small subunit ribosomal protein S14
MVERQAKRQKLVLRYAARRAEYRRTIRNPQATDEERRVAQEKLQALPRDASPVRLRNRCAVSGRPHGFYRKFGLARNKLREATMLGDLPGLSKASW